MEIWSNYKGHKQEKIGTTDNTIYSFDIETTSYIVLRNTQINSIDYLKLTDDEKQNSYFQSTMYIWTFSINESVYYGRTWKDFIQFMELLKHKTSKKLKKYIFVHNLSWEFEFLRNCMDFDLVFARKSRKVIKCTNEYFNIEFRCTYFMTNVKLEKIPKIYGLDTKKLVGNLDYTKPRHSETKLSKEELQYCENDCLVIYEYIKLQLKNYKSVSKLPLTSTGFVRRELKKITYRNFKYERKVQRAINTDGHIFNLLNKSFMGGYTHANWVFARSNN